jgi:exopolyphosphatase / guanosine-5'-triphosphate,3'-diphosphate pyrophosphatase
MTIVPFQALPAEVPAGGRLAVIDIGSNSIRLVVYDALKRVPLPIFNEKSMCGLGRGLARTGYLNRDGVGQGLSSLTRFRRIADGMGVARIDLLATAAVRDAADGPWFIETVERITGLTVQIVPGEREAQLAALGVLSGAPDASGLVGDLGGGSLELVRVDQHRIDNHVTLPLGPLRLMEQGGGRQEAVLRTVDQHLQGLSWLPSLKGADFYAVGGAWRSLAKLHMERVKHPLHIIHNYAIPAAEAADFAARIAATPRQTLEKLPSARRRADTIPHAALVLERVLRTAMPRRVVFTAYGLREGHLFSLLNADEQRRDPLIAACRDVSAMTGRPSMAEALFHWTEGLIAGEDERSRRLRDAAAHLYEVAWTDHPDYRAEAAFLRVLRYPFPAVDHAERAFLALVSLARYGGSAEAPVAQVARGLLSAGEAAKATVLGLAFRLAHTLTGDAGPLLRRTSLRMQGDNVMLTLPDDESVLGGETVERRLGALATMLNRQPSIARGRMV